MNREINVTIAADKRPPGILNRVESIAKIGSLLAIPVLVAFVAYLGSRLQSVSAVRNTDVQMRRDYVQLAIATLNNHDLTPEEREASFALIRENAPPGLSLKGAVRGTVPAVAVPASTGSPAVGATPEGLPWEYQSFQSGNEAARVLEIQHADPTDVYSAISGGKDIWVWWKRGHSEYKYTYNYVPWDPKHVPLPDTPVSANGSIRRIPIGFGGVSGRTVFVFFEATRQSSPTPIAR